MASTIQVPVAPVRLSAKATPAIRPAVSREPRHWPEMLLALTLTAAAFVLNATFIGSVIGIPLFLLALGLLTSFSSRD